MQKSKRKHGDQPVRVFKQSQFSKFFTMALITLTVVFFAYTANEVDVDWNSPLTIGMLLFMTLMYGLIIIYLVMHLSSRTDIYEDGIGVQHGNSYSFTKWDNLAYFEVRTQGRNTITGIVTRNPVERTVSGGRIEQWLHSQPDPQFFEVGAVTIPQKENGLFSKPGVHYDKLVQTEFGQLLYEYAPHLYEGEKVK